MIIESLIIIKEKIIEDSNDYFVERDELGRTMKLCKGVATIAHPMDYPVKDMDTWLKIKPLFVFNENRINWDVVENAKRLQGDGYLVVGNIPGGFDGPRQLMGEENACLSYYTQPELMYDMLGTFLDTSYKVFDRISDALVIDQLSVHEDLAGKSGPLVGPSQIKEFINPYFSKIWNLLSSRGTRLFDMDSDGNINSVLESFLECGINSLHPFEPAAGMDIVEVRKKYGTRIAIRGGINKYVLRESKEDIRKELEYKMQPLMQQGGLAFGLDHRILNGTPLNNYRYYVDLGRQILGLPNRIPGKKGWKRMAF